MFKVQLDLETRRDQKDLKKFSVDHLLSGEENVALEWRNVGQTRSNESHFQDKLPSTHPISCSAS